MIITTTPLIEGWLIKSYKHPISANVIIGTNIFSEIGAGWTDFFGGKASSYERKMQSIYREVMDKLTKAAKSVGSNAIIGLTIDIDEISGKGTQMFMITAVGTPVYTVRVIAADIEPANSTLIDGEKVENKVRAKTLISFYEKAKSIKDFNNDIITFISESGLLEFSGLVLNSLSEDPSYDASLKEKLNKLYYYFSSIDQEAAAELLYNELLKENLSVLGRNNTVNAILTLNLIVYDRIDVLLNSENIDAKINALLLLKSKKEFYFIQDIDYLKNSINTLSGHFPEIVGSAKSKQLFSSSQKEVWICLCSTKNNPDNLVCSSCGKDKRGLLPKENTPEKVIEIIQKRLDVIEEL